MTEVDGRANGIHDCKSGWRYEKEDCPPWKRIVDSCNRMEGGLELAVKNRGDRMRGGIWDNILGLSCTEKELTEIFRQGVELVVGNGRKVKFWHSLWDGMDLEFLLEEDIMGLGERKITGDDGNVELSWRK
ncbi:hypothetical protein PIB30_093171 [Stylosanthes scabra]|uniref:Uncharacterized protein n=1 Tax=Stylosanthes scabra TaxID=79078 RepID=A0ABU6QUE5_9FABA|nr:hypothetical protein [Stylosanthes scabra]